MSICEIKADLYNIISDQFKSLHGFRPRGIYDVAAMSVEELEAELADLSAAIKADIKAEKAQKQADREEREWLRFHYIIGSE
jgi:uncharacterized small protein (DUF1192 family)